MMQYKNPHGNMITLLGWVSDHILGTSSLTGTARSINVYPDRGNQESFGGNHSMQLTTSPILSQVTGQAVHWKWCWTPIAFESSPCQTHLANHQISNTIMPHENWNVSSVLKLCQIWISENFHKMSLPLGLADLAYQLVHVNLAHEQL